MECAFFCLSLSLLSLTTAKSIVISSSGKDLPGCDVCHSLEYVANGSNISNTVIRINSTNYTLDGVAQFTGVNNITITGQEQNTTVITCNTTNGGLSFLNSSNIVINELAVMKCLFNPEISNYNNGTAVMIQNCANINITCVHIAHSPVQALTISNCTGLILVENSSFYYNQIGLRVLANHTYHMIMTISRCCFTNNRVKKQTSDSYFEWPPYYLRGAGLGLIIIESSSNCSVVVEHTKFVKNNGMFGGGLHVSMARGAIQNSIQVTDCEFIGNVAKNLSGGGADVGFTHSHKFNSTIPTGNRIVFQNCTFKNNLAFFGGGLSVFIAGVFNFNRRDKKNFVDVINCTFTNNKANGGAAVDISPDTLKSSGRSFIGSVYIIDCSFEYSQRLNESENHIRSNGAFYVSKITVTFKGTIKFSRNTNTALYVVSTYVGFKNSSLTFDNNTGDCGGGVHLEGNAAMGIHENTAFQFTNNSASYGGAICARLDEAHSYVYTASCFLSITNKNNSFSFSDNSASSLMGKDIFATTFRPCLGLCEYHLRRKLTLVALFNSSCFAHFSSNVSLATSPWIFNISVHNKSIKPIPGRPFKLNYHIIDETGTDIATVFHPTAKLVNHIGKASIDSGYEVLNNKSMSLSGEPGYTGLLKLEVSGLKQQLEFTFSGCPPGFNKTGSHDKCKCACREYEGVTCDSNGSAKISVGHWIGYSNGTALTGICATELCSYTHKKRSKGHYLLPQNKSVLAELICGNTRTGRLCGRCAENYSVYYHSENYTCGNSSGCSYGVPLYVLSELLPVTVLFLVILVFNVSLTSGALYSFVFYAQTIAAMTVTAFSSIRLQIYSSGGVLEALHVIYGLFNLDIFDNNKLSFCLIDTKSLMNLFMFKYATTLYALLLVLGTILVLKLHSCYSCVRLCRRCGRRNIRGSIVDGLSAFIVLCYSQCAFNTMLILVSVNITSHDQEHVYRVPLFDGELNYLQGDHWWYAVPAFLCITFILIPPPLVLLLEPFLTKLFSLKWFERTFISWHYNKLRLKIMPFLDSFQSCFKDKHRYFAGLYFIYRTLPSLSAVLSNGIFVCYGVVSFVLIFILLLHTFVQPYKSNRHCMLELFLFINLIAVNTLTAINYRATVLEATHNNHEVRAYLVIQAILLSLPIGYFICYTLLAIYKKVTTPFQRIISITHNSTTHTKIDDASYLHFPARMLRDDSISNYNSI